jgi:hypothetical protein
VAPTSLDCSGICIRELIFKDHLCGGIHIFRTFPFDLRIAELFFRVVRLYQSIDSDTLQDPPDLILLGNDKDGTMVVSHIAQPVDEEADSSAAKKRGFPEVENKIAAAFSNQPGNFIVENFGAFGAVDIADDINRLEAPQILYFVLHAVVVSPECLRLDVRLHPPFWFVTASLTKNR